ncbi:pentapeptide repeat-containing protein [Tenacibaculum agarivorans]|uniref:pentapeptide repeat-containing protein n=1 Tax=Tenacibaculum agarivorans TaxID=1908389 RepID=UPI00094B89D9|nr:pentapeptide repeat-containing protein [Tenacibaculum agarivorans]
MTEEEIAQLQEENEVLKQQLKRIDEKKAKSLRFKFFLTKKVATFFIGRNLKESIQSAIIEFNEDKKLSKDTIADVTANIIWRLTRIGIVGLLIALLPTVLLVQQNWIITKQNKLFEKQNEKIEIQTQLEEASRRSSQMFIMGEVLSDINKELENKDSTEGILSSTLMGRIISLSRAMKPYKFIQTYTAESAYKDSLGLTKLLSPERGQLLITLLHSNINKVFLRDSMLNNRNINFRYADLSFLQVNNRDLSGIDLKSASLDFSNFDNVTLKRVNLNEASIVNTSFKNVALHNAFLINTNLEGANFYKADLRHTILTGANMEKIRSLDSVKVHRYDWLSYIRDTLKLKGAEKIAKEYRVDSVVYPHFNKNGELITGKKAPILLRKY